MYCPSIRASDVELNVDDTLFSIHVNPYFLRLNFSYALLGDESEDAAAAAYDPSSGYLTVTLTKQVKGQDFKDLDLLAKLLAPRPTERAPDPPTIEVLASEDAPVDDINDLANRTEELALGQNEIMDAAENDWQLPQEVPGPLPPLKTTPEHRYGFLDMHSGYLRHVAYTENEVNELGADAETSTPDERRRRRIQHEEKKWDEEYYMADYIEDECIQELIVWTNPLTRSNEEIRFSDDENMTMLRLPRKEYLATSQQTHDLYLTLLTLLFSYAYEFRTTQADPTPESAWTLSSLTPAFSALDPAPYHDNGAQASGSSSEEFSTPELVATFATCYRRALAFPLYRSLALAEACRLDVAAVLACGRRAVARWLLGMKHILDHHDVYYVYSKIWVDDFCTWVLACASDDALMRLAIAVRELQVSKGAMGWDLEVLENVVQQELERSPDSDDDSDEEEIERMLPAPL